MSCFDDRVDDMDAFLHRFEVYADSKGWKKGKWAVYLSALLKGKALDVYSRLPYIKKVKKMFRVTIDLISLLSIFDKLLEKLTYRCLSNFLEKNKFLYEYQFGFRKKYSTAQAVMEVLDNIYQYCDNHEITMGIYLDLQKAFDTVNHTILLQKLAIYGIRGTVLQWFDSYLANRKQYTVLGDNKSELETVSYGVPQGSVLGLLLFLIYVNDIQYAISTAKVKLFAHDINLFLHNCNPAQLFADANICMAQLLNNIWMLMQTEIGSQWIDFRGQVIRNLRKEMKGEMIEGIITRKKEQMIGEMMLGMIEEMTGDDRKCFVCGKKGHLVRNCSHANKTAGMSDNQDLVIEEMRESR